MTTITTSTDADTGDMKSRVAHLAEQWRTCQAELTRLRRLQDKRLMANDADGHEFFELAELEDALRRKSKVLVRAMVETRSDGLDDVLLKLNIWRDVKCPKGTKLSGKTLYNHLAVSVLDDVAGLRCSKCGE